MCLETLCTGYVLAKDASPAASPQVITPAMDTGVPQYPAAYNGDTATHTQVTTEVTESSSPAAYTEPALPGRHAESDNSMLEESVSDFSYHTVHL